MNLPKLGYSRAIQHGAGGATGMIIVGSLLAVGLGIVVERPMAERSEQAFDVALQIEKRERTHRRPQIQSAHHIRIHAAGRADRDAFHLQRFRSRRLEYIPHFEQADVVVAAVQVVGQHIQHAGNERGAHDGSLVAQGVRQVELGRARKAPGILFRNESQ